MPRDATCETCRLWKPHRAIDGGNCRAHPPTVFLNHTIAETHFPYTEKADWCGEHSPKEKPDAT